MGTTAMQAVSLWQPAVSQIAFCLLRQMLWCCLSTESGRTFLEEAAGYLARDVIDLDVQELQSSISQPTERASGHIRYVAYVEWKTGVRQLA